MDHLDKTDLKILSILQRDGRITNAKLSGQLGLGTSTTLDRVRKLEQSGVIEKYVALVNGKKVNRGTVAFVFVSFDWYLDTARKTFFDQIMEFPEVQECYSIAGEFDLLLKAVFADLDECNYFLHEKLKKMSGVRTIRTKTSFVLEVHKHETAFTNLLTE